MNKLLLSQKEIQETVPAFDEHLLFALERRYFDFLRPDRLELCENVAESNFDYRTDLRMIRMDEISHEGEADLGLHLMHFQNVLASMKDDSHNVISVIHGDKQKTSLYYGLAKRRDRAGTLGTDQYARMLGQTIHGNFLGAKFKPLSAVETQNEVVVPLLDHGEVTAFTGIPSLRDSKGPYVQGIDRFIEAMRGENYVLLCIAEPVGVPMVDGMVKNLFDLSSDVHANVKATVQKMKGSSDTVNIGMFGMRGVMNSSTGGTAETDGTTDSQSETIGTQEGSTRLGSGGALIAAGGAASMAVGGLLGGLVGSIVPGAGTIIGATLGAKIGGIFGSVAAPMAASAMGMPLASSVGRSIANTNTASQMHSFTRSIANTAGNTLGGGGFGGYAKGWNRSSSVSQEVLNRTAMHCEQLCESYIRRLQRGKNLGFWNVGIYLLTSDKYTQLRGQGLLRASLAGDETYWEPIRALPLQTDAVMAYLANFNNPQYNLLRYGIQKNELNDSIGWGVRIANMAKKIASGSVDRLISIIANTDDKTSTDILEKIRREPAQYSQEVLDKAWEEIESTNLGHPLGPVLGGIGTPLNTEELSIVMNLPRREVQGITLREAPAFGVNYAPLSENALRIGRVVHKRKPLDELPYQIPRSLLQKHAFVCGVTGSGKTNTCIRLLRDIELPFMVIEPAKTEYRQMLKKMPDLKIFTLGTESISPFRINPFEFVPGCELLTHIDSLKAVFSAAFPMYAAMPYMLEEAIIGIYQDKGWELATSSNRYLDNIESEHFYDYLPTLQDLLEKIDDVVNSKKYAIEQTMNYSAALKARISSLLTGSKGLMLNTRRSTPIEKLLNNKVVLELKYIGDDEEKCFLMGLLLSAIYEYREKRGGIGSSLKHVLLIEESHRLLKRVPDYVSPEVGNSRGKAVETFTNVISEIREFGQGIIVVDQIPSKLAEDVIKNTNVKIIHRTLAKDDRDYVGATMNLTDEQSRELCLLEPGQAVIHREGMDKAFLVQIDLEKEPGCQILDDNAISNDMQSFHRENSFVFMRYPGFEKIPGIATFYARQDFRKFHEELYLGIIGAFLLVLSGEAENLETIRASFRQQLQRRVRRSETVDVACHAIFYMSALFSSLNSTYPGCYDKCISMNKEFVDYWFNNKGNLEKIRSDMKYLLMHDHLTAPFFGYYINKIDGETPKRLFASWEDSDQDYSTLDDFLEEGIKTLLFDSTISIKSKKALREDFLWTVLAGNPRRSIIMKKMAN